ncbi:hypothetical protein [Tessaracoccus oleiagri]|uniref:hypothetical protein n=1 Tax=Tessaracoccus oleiagri TaxID=686624 RepID=UPI000B861937|nr:hypothetical protein [Tessaracoccus oleiagri]
MSTAFIQSVTQRNPVGFGLVSATLLVVFGVLWSISSGVAGRDAIGFVLYYVLGLCLPGTIVLKTCLGTRGTWLADLVWGSITGICLELFAWALFSLLQLQGWLRLWPLLVLALVALRGPRKRVFELPKRVSSPWIAVSGLIVTLSLWARVWWPFTLTYDLPPNSRPYYIDLPWHMGLAVEATRAFPLHVPQMLDAGLLKYSWFVHAHLGAASLMSGIDVPTLLLRLWGAPMIALAVFSVALLAERVAGRAFAGVTAVLVFGSQGQFAFWRDITGNSNYLSPLSPTSIFTVVVSCLTVLLLVELLRGTLALRGWLLLAIAAVVSAGSKSSTMVVLAAAVFGTTIVALILRHRRRELIVASAGALTLTVFALALVSGGGDSTKLQILGALTLLPPFRHLGGNPEFNSRFADDLVRLEGVGTWLLLALMLGILLRMVVAMSAVFVPIVKGLRSDLAAWLLGGILVAAWLPFLLMSHRGYSQYYFLYGAMPFGAVLWGWITAIAVGRSPSRRAGLVLAAGLGLLGTWFWTLLPDGSADSAWLHRLQEFLFEGTAFIAALAVLAFAGFHLRERLPWGLAASLGLFLGSLTVPYVTAPIPGPPAPVSAETAERSLAEGTAASWISEHVGLHDVMATNTACSNTSTSCNTKRWWISGVGGRRVLVEGWGYTPDGADGVLDSDEVLRVNTEAFANPTDATIQAMRDRGVEWMVVESLDGFPQPDLTPWGEVAYSNALVTIYRLEP